MLPLSYFPDSSVKHTDWEVAAVGTFTLAAGAAARAGLFSFPNGSYATDPVYSGLCYDMLFIGGGIGVDIVARMRGLKERGQSKPSGLFKKWRPIHCDRPFSAMDLSGSSGRITSLTVTVIDIVLISAGDTSGSLFGGQSVTGLGLGFGGAHNRRRLDLRILKWNCVWPDCTSIGNRSGLADASQVNSSYADAIRCSYQSVLNCVDRTRSNGAIFHSWISIRDEIRSRVVPLTGFLSLKDGLRQRHDFLRTHVESHL